MNDGGGFGALLRQARLAAGLTQEELAERSGLSVRALSDLERGRSSHPHRRSVELLVKALNPSETTGARLLTAARRLTPQRERSESTPAQLPADLPDFTGRADEMATLTELLTDPGPAPAIAVIGGAGGTGKTALAVHVGHRVRHAFPAGQLYLNLHGTDDQPMTAAAALGRLLRDLGVAADAIPGDTDERASLYRTLLVDRWLLVLLDNARDAEQVRPLLPGTPGSLVVITSRRQLPGLTAVEGAHPISLDL
ncbi:MAG TPA: helix-turn-helix transcriptional regulator, partial [Pseudonocardiaceae bacterium]|nr:helix-turn-helix transcriptional regulator [Pseudonocardiaceae bacterium]